MFNIVKIFSCELINVDCLEFIWLLFENFVDLIVMDLLYFKVKFEGWDNQWKGDDDYLKWLDQCLVQFWWVLKFVGSFYLFCGYCLVFDIEIMMCECFSVLNYIIWVKLFGCWNGCNKESLWVYFFVIECILFVEYYQGLYCLKDVGYVVKGSVLKQYVMVLLIFYFCDVCVVLGIMVKQIVDVIGKKNMVLYWFSVSQWQLLNESDYLKLQLLFVWVVEEKYQCGELEKFYYQLVDMYMLLNWQYVELQSEYKYLWWYFGVMVQVLYMDVWIYKLVQFYFGKYLCEKLVEMLQQIISVSSCLGDLVVDFFMGLGLMVKVVLVFGCCVIGVELEIGCFEQIVREVQDLIV